MYTKEMKGEAAIMRGGSPPLREGGWVDHRGLEVWGQPASSHCQRAVVDTRSLQPVLAHPTQYFPSISEVFPKHFRGQKRNEPQFI